MPSAVQALAAISTLAVVLIFLIPPSSLTLIPAAAHAWQTGFYPDGFPLRRKYTGFMPMDLVLMIYGGAFSAATDGNDEATHRFCLWFLPQLCSTLVFTYWEAGRTKQGFAKFPTAVCMAAQFLTAGVTLPVYFISHILSVPTLTNTLPLQHLSRARTVFAAVALGYLLPSTFLLYSPSGATIDDVQIIAAIWQPFPLYIAAAWAILRTLDAHADRPTDRAHTLNWLRQTYYVCGVLSGIFHLRVMLPALTTAEPAHSFANVFVPFWMHGYLPLGVPSTPTIAPSSFYPLTLYRPATRLLFQHDWLTATLAALVFFGRHHREALRILEKEEKRDLMSFRVWVAYMVGISVIGGPGAAIAWAAVKREETLFAYAAEDLKTE